MAETSKADETPGVAKGHGDASDSPAGSAQPPMIFVDGVAFPVFFQTNRPMAEQVECIKNLDLREDDVIIAAYPKCGTHWLWEVCSMLLAGRADYEARTKEFAMMEASPMENIWALPSPRILNTHVPVRMLPKQIKGKGVKVIHVYRNAKDVLVSLYFHARQNPGFEDITIDSMVRRLVDSDGKGEGGAYVKYLKEMDGFIKENPDVPVFNISFEDTKEDPLRVVKNLGDFLGVQATPEMCAHIVKATSFQNMKKADENKQQVDHMPKVQMYRKGEVGDWKNHLTVAQSEILDDVMKQVEGCDFRFRYTL